MKNIMIWSDFACPYCYIGEKRLKDAILELGVENEVSITYRAFELNPDASIRPEGDVTERLAQKYGMTIEEAKRRIEEIDRLGREIGLDMRYSKAKYSNTFDAHRLMKFAETEYSKEILEALNESLFKAYFTDHKVLSDRRLLLSLAEEAGMDPIQSKEVLEQGLYADDVRYDEREAAMRGVRGVPYMVFDGKFAVPGAISTDDFKSALREMLVHKKNVKEHFQGNQCDEKGCKI